MDPILALYGTDPIRGRLAEELYALVVAAEAERGTISRRKRGGEPLVPWILIDRSSEVPRRDMPSGIPEVALRALTSDRLSSGRTRPARLGAMFLVDRGDFEWYLTLDSSVSLRLGTEIAEHIERVSWLGIGRISDIDLDRDDATADPEALRDSGLGHEAAHRFEAAIEDYEIALDRARDICDTDLGLELLSLLGRALRKLGDLDRSLVEYRRGETLAKAMADTRMEARIGSGIGHVLRILGSYPAALAAYERALELTEEVGDGLVAGACHQGLAMIHRAAGEIEPALVHGWAAYHAFDDERDRLGALVSLGTTWRSAGHLDVAEAAYEIAAARSTDPDIRLLALDALAHVAALSGNRREYERRMADVEAAAPAEGSVNAEAQIGYFRAKNELAFGEIDAARSSATSALRLAEEHRLGKLIIDIDELLASLENPELPPDEPIELGPDALATRKELRALHQSVSR